MNIKKILRERRMRNAMKNQRKRITESSWDDPTVLKSFADLKSDREELDDVDVEFDDDDDNYEIWNVSDKDLKANITTKIVDELIDALNMEGANITLEEQACWKLSLMEENPDNKDIYLEDYEIDALIDTIPDTRTKNTTRRKLNSLKHKYGEGYTYEEIGDILKVTEAAIRKTANKAMKKLREGFQKKGVSAEEGRAILKDVDDARSRRHQRYSMGKGGDDSNGSDFGDMIEID